MFITLTIDTNQKRKASKVRFSKTKFDPTKGWKKAMKIKKRGVMQRVRAFTRSLRARHYKFNGQIAAL